MPSEEGEGGANDEMESAQTSLNEYETKGRMQGQSLWQRLFEVRVVFCTLCCLWEPGLNRLQAISSLLMRQQGFTCPFAQIWALS